MPRVPRRLRARGENQYRPHLSLRISDYAWITQRQAATALTRSTPDQWSRGHRSPVVLLPGVWERWPILASLADRLNALGHPVYTVPSLGFNRRPIPDAAARVAERLVELDVSDVVLLAHSKGGLIGKAVILGPAAPRVRRLIAISTPFGGSWYAGFMLVPSLREFRPRAATIAAMGRQLEANERITSIFGTFDPHIPEGSRLPGATNIELAVEGHFRPLADYRVAEAVEVAAGE